MARLVIGTSKAKTVPAVVRDMSPRYYRSFGLNGGMLIQDRTTSVLFDFSGIQDINEYILYRLYDDNPNVSGVISMPDMIKLSGTCCMQSSFSGCRNIIGFTAPNLKRVGGSKALFGAFASTGISGVVSLPSLESATDSQSIDTAFYNTAITKLDLPSLVQLGRRYVSATAQSFVAECRSLIEINLCSLKTLWGSYCLRTAFQSTALTSLSFPALANPNQDSQPNKMNDMLRNVTGCTVHFPSNMQSVIGSWSDVTNGFGGTNTTVLFDLPATNVLTGANSTEYERSPKYDTATALAWRVKDGEYDNAPVIDWTPFYTSGTSDPTVGTTIYSDASCTTAVTTVASIA